MMGTLDAPWAPVQKVNELLDDPQVVANGYIGELDDGEGPSYKLPTVPVQYDQQPPKVRRAPELGQHTEVILMELGYEWEQISQMQSEGIIP